MSEDSVNAYEGLFLFPQSKAASLREAVDHIEEIIGRAEAELISLKKWDERRLAYEIRGNKRGIYFLAYFRARASAMVSMERDCNLSEQLLRTLIVQADQMTNNQMEAADGRAAIADEIRLRDEEASQRQPEAGSDEEPRGSKEPVEVKVESIAQDAATSSEA